MSTAGKEIDMAGVQQEDRQLILKFYTTKDCGLRPKQPDRTGQRESKKLPRCGLYTKSGSKPTYHEARILNTVTRSEEELVPSDSKVLLHCSFLSSPFS